MQRLGRGGAFGGPLARRLDASSSALRGGHEGRACSERCRRVGAMTDGAQLDPKPLRALAEWLAPDSAETAEDL